MRHLNFFKLFLAWPLFLFLQFRINWVSFRFRRDLRKAKHRIKERQRYLFVRRYSRLLRWFYTHQRKILGLENWRFGATVLIISAISPLVPLLLLQNNDFTKTAPLSFCFTFTYLQTLPLLLKKFYLLLNHFILNDQNLDHVLKKQILTNLQIPRTLAVFAPHANEKTAAFLANLIEGGMPNLHFVTFLKRDQIQLKLQENYSSRQVLRINKKFLMIKLERFLN